MPDDADPPTQDAPTQDAAAETNAYYPPTSRPVDPTVEALLPRYAEWCRRIMFQTALSQNAEEPPEDFLKAIIPRAIRHVRRIARNEGSRVAIDVMNSDGTSPLHWVMFKVRGEWEEGGGGGRVGGG